MTGRTIGVLFLVLGGCLLVMGASLAEDHDAPLEVGMFSREIPGNTLPQGWEPLHFKKIEQHTQYSLVQNGGKTVVRANSQASASGMVRKMEIDLVHHPVISWSWKAMDVLEKGNVTQKKGDDYPARIYVTFRYTPEKMGFWDRTKYKTAKAIHGEYPPHAAINYIWASKAMKGIFVPNPYSDRVMMIVVESGAEKLGTWVMEERNILEDYKKAFGEDPPPISGIAIMTDTDNTSESATCYYGDIFFKSPQP